jgi:2-dehydro-3-deoxyphosphogluconate aldolase / (4S)-4-hydroxy-2-oxoglutarate aldolase
MMLSSVKSSTDRVHFLAQAKLVAIIRLPDLSGAVEMSRALVSGGFKVLEFTLNSPGALEAITKVRDAFSTQDVMVGAGTVLTADEARSAIDAGAEFCISPTLKLPVIEVCKREGVMVIPAGFTPTEIEAAWDAGADVVKVFPSRAVGPKYLKEIHGPFPDIRLMPTGGVEREMIADFLAAGAVAVGVGGASLLNPQVIAESNWDAITQTARQYIKETSVGRA